MTPLRARTLASIAVLAGALVCATPARAAWRPDGVPLRGGSIYDYFRDPGVAPDGAGGVFASWFDGARMMRVQHLNGAGEYAAGWPLNGLSPTTLIGPQHYGARLSPDGSGGVYVVWLATLCSSSCHFEPGQVYIQRMTGGGQVAAGWPAAGIPVTNEYSREPPLVCPDGAGGVVVAWKPHLYPPRNLVHAQRLDAAGNRLWTASPNGAPVAPASTGSQDAPALAPDGSGGAFIAWVDRRGLGLTSTIYLQHFDAAGAVAHPGGVLLSSGSLNQRGPGIEADGAGGIFAAWEDSSAGAGFDIRAQRVNALTRPQWGPGVAVTEQADGDQREVALARDGANGVFLGWSDGRSGSDRVFAMRLDGAGRPAASWPTGGLETNTAAGSQRTPRMVADAAGGVYLSWANTGITTATHLRSDGTPAPGWSAAGAPLCSGNCGSIMNGTYLVADGQGGAIAVWDEVRVFPIGADPEQSFAARAGSDGPVAALASLVSADAGAGRVRIEWQVSEPASFTLERAAGDAAGGWSRLGVVTADAAGRVVVEDREVRAGSRYGYRLVQDEAGRPVTIAERWITVPELGLRIAGTRPAPASGALVLDFSLADETPATLELVDVTGRRVLTRRIEGLAAGAHQLRLPETEGLSPGIYAIRLTQGGRSTGASISLVR